MRCYLIAFFAAVLLGGFFMPAFGQGAVCGERDKMLAYLKKEYGETPRMLLLTASGIVLEILTAEDGTWTMLSSSPEGRSCIAATGKAHGALRAKKGPGT